MSVFMRRGQGWRVERRGVGWIAGVHGEGWGGRRDGLIELIVVASRSSGQSA